jgi:hypothetical protein
VSDTASHRHDPVTEGEWIRELAKHGRASVTYRGRRIAYPRNSVTLVGGALDHTQVPAVAEIVLGTLLRDVLSRQGVYGIEQHRRSIVTAARIAPLFAERIERSITFAIGEDELVDALAPN